LARVKSCATEYGLQTRCAGTCGAAPWGQALRLRALTASQRIARPMAVGNTSHWPTSIPSKLALGDCCVGLPKPRGARDQLLGSRGGLQLTKASLCSSTSRRDLSSGRPSGYFVRHYNLRSSRIRGIPSHLRACKGKGLAGAARVKPATGASRSDSFCLEPPRLSSCCVAARSRATASTIVGLVLPATSRCASALARLPVAAQRRSACVVVKLAPPS